MQSEEKTKAKTRKINLVKDPTSKSIPGKVKKKTEN